MGFPGEAQEFQGLMREGDIAVLSALAAVDVEHVARAIDIAHLKVKRFVQAQPTAGDGGEGDAMVQGGSGVEETVHLFQAEESREAVFGRCANEVESLPAACKDVVGEEAEGAVADAHGTGREVVDMLAVEDVLLQLLCREKVRRCAGELSQQAYLTDRGLLGAFALATELESSQHLLT